MSSARMAAILSKGRSVNKQKPIFFKQNMKRCLRSFYHHRNWDTFNKQFMSLQS